MKLSKSFRILALQALIAVGGLLTASTSNAQFYGGGSSGVSAWTYCTGENSVCNIQGVNDVAYGAQNSWAYIQNVRGPINCNNNTFGDPIPGIVKECWYKPARGGPGGGRRDVIRIQSATYGGNVRAGVNNAWQDVAQKCNALRECNYLVSVRNLGDPAPGRRKDFVVEFTCDRTPQRPVVLPAEADGKIAHLRCF